MGLAHMLAMQMGRDVAMPLLPRGAAKLQATMARVVEGTE